MKILYYIVVVSLPKMIIKEENIMKIKEEIKSKVAVLYLSGDLLGGEPADMLQEKVKSLISEGLKNIVIDLKGVKWINSTGLGALMSSLTTVRNKEGDIRLSRVTDKVDSLLNITKLITVFQTFETDDRAVVSFELES